MSAHPVRHQATDTVPYDSNLFWQRSHIACAASVLSVCAQQGAWWTKPRARAPSRAKLNVPWLTVPQHQRQHTAPNEGVLRGPEPLTLCCARSTPHWQTRGSPHATVRNSYVLCMGWVAATAATSCIHAYPAPPPSTFACKRKPLRCNVFLLCSMAVRGDAHAYQRPLLLADLAEARQRFAADPHRGLELMAQVALACVEEAAGDPGMFSAFCVAYCINRAAR